RAQVAASPSSPRRLCHAASFDGPQRPAHCRPAPGTPPKVPGTATAAVDTSPGTVTPGRPLSRICRCPVVLDEVVEDGGVGVCEVPGGGNHGDHGLVPP